MRKIFFALIACNFLLLSCGSKNAFKYSEALAQKEESLKYDIEETESQVKKYFQDGMFDSMAAVSEKMVDLVNTKLQEIKDMKAPAVKESENFKTATIDYFTYIKKVYSYYVDYAKTESEDEKESKLESLKEFLGKKEQVLNTMRNAQRKYADANGFKLAE